MVDGVKSMPATLLCDFYKVSHREQYPEGTDVVYSTWTPRSNKHFPMADHAIALGFQGFICQFLMDLFDKEFFKKDKQDVISEYSRYMKFCLGIENPDIQHISDLHDLGYLPLVIKAVPEGTKVPMRVPMMVIYNTDKRFFWLPNYFETLLSCECWLPSTTATIANLYMEILTSFAEETGDPSFVPFQGHDFSMRGMERLAGAELGGFGHLAAGFVGTDTIPAIGYAERYYGANIENEMVGVSVPATEHSVMCAGGKEDEFETYRRLITETYPAGIVSIVSDTWDLWKCLDKVGNGLYDEIMARDGKVVFRPDSGDPADILCGDIDIVNFHDPEYSQYHLETPEDCAAMLAEDLVDQVREETEHGEQGDCDALGYFEFEGKYYEVSVDITWNRHDKQYYYIDGYEVDSVEEYELTPENKGVISILWEIFGGSRNDKGYLELDPHVGAIYGDSITPERCYDICERLKNKGFASTNVVFGIGSFTYQFNTRDTFGFAMKATAVVINGEEQKIFKDPVTDDGTKKSATGAVAVQYDSEGCLTYVDGLSIYHKEEDLMDVVYKDGQLLRFESLSDIRNRING